MLKLVNKQDESGVDMGFFSKRKEEQELELQRRKNEIIETHKKIHEQQMANVTIPDHCQTMYSHAGKKLKCWRDDNNLYVYDDNLEDEIESIRNDSYLHLKIFISVALMSMNGLILSLLEI